MICDGIKDCGRIRKIGSYRNDNRSLEKKTSGIYVRDNVE
jgi:hypothetical protein